jgi:hypothetical protein
MSDKRSSVISMFGDGGEGGRDHSPRPLGRKRYSSSFGHRYVVGLGLTGAGVTGGPGSGMGE